MSGGLYLLQVLPRSSAWTQQPCLIYVFQGVLHVERLTLCQLVQGTGMM